MISDYIYYDFILNHFVCAVMYVSIMAGAITEDNKGILFSCYVIFYYKWNFQKY